LPQSIEIPAQILGMRVRIPANAPSNTTWEFRPKDGQFRGYATYFQRADYFLGERV
jgi:hypothetical protein